MGVNNCYAVVIAQVADYIKYNLHKVGNTGVDVEVTDTSEIEAQEPSAREIKATVASLRLDCVTSAGFGISRSKITEFIKAEKVNLNWDTATSPAKQIKEGDTISLRGKGRVIVDKIGGTTEKNRIKITLKRLI